MDFWAKASGNADGLAPFPPMRSQARKEASHSLPLRAHGAEWRAPEHRSREAQRAACRSAAGRRRRQTLEAASAESEGP